MSFTKETMLMAVAHRFGLESDITLAFADMLYSLEEEEVQGIYENIMEGGSFDD